MSHPVPRELLNTDLNLLISLQVLLEEKSVSRAASRLFITQPAMSKTLGRLREVFDDPLFTRSSHGMLPTPRALEIGEDLAQVLQDIQHLVSGPGFDPAAYRGELTIALSEFIGVWLMPALMYRLQTQAPGLRLKSITRVEKQLQQLAEGELDLAIHIKHSRYTDDFMVEPIGGNPPAVLVRQGHPLCGQEITMDSFNNYPLLRLYISDREELEVFQDEDMLANRMEAQRERGGFETSHLLTALEVLRNTDYIMAGPPFLLRNPTVTYKIVALPTPVITDYQIEYMLVRHKRTYNSPIHNWLWAQILEVLQDFRDSAVDS